MVEKVIMQDCSVIDFRRYQQARQLAAEAGLNASSLAPRCCRHCGAALLDGESDDDCSTAELNGPALREPPRRFYAE